MINTVTIDLVMGQNARPRKCAEDMKLGEAADTPGCFAAFQKDLYRLEHWADRNHLQFNREMENAVSGEEE